MRLFLAVCAIVLAVSLVPAAQGQQGGPQSVEWRYDGQCGSVNTRVVVLPMYSRSRGGWIVWVQYRDLSSGRRSWSGEEGQLVRSWNATGPATASNVMTFRPDRPEPGAYDVIFRRAGAGWAAEVTDPGCNSAVRPTIPGASAYVADGGAASSGRAWLGRSPFDRVGGQTLFQYLGMDPANYLTPLERAPATRWLPSEDVRGLSLRLTACGDAACTSQRKRFFIFSLPARPGQYTSILAIAATGVRETQICRARSTETGWFCLRTQQALPAHLAPDDLYIWAASANQAEAQRWEAAHPRPPAPPCYEVVLDARYGDNVRRQVCPPAPPGPTMPNEPRQ